MFRNFSLGSTTEQHLCRSMNLVIMLAILKASNIFGLFFVKYYVKNWKNRKNFRDARFLPIRNLVRVKHVTLLGLLYCYCVKRKEF